VLRISLFLTECLLIITNTHLPVTLDVTSVICQKIQYIYMTVLKDRNTNYLLIILLKVFILLCMPILVGYSKTGWITLKSIELRSVVCSQNRISGSEF